MHRPHRRDWTFPKGKADPGEDDESCALREVAEETGLRCRLGSDLGTIGYVDAKGRPKIVHWWAMTADTDTDAGVGVDGGAVPGAGVAPSGPRSADEVDELRWLPPGDAAALLSYDNDRTVLARFLRTVPAPPA